jgi:Ca2+-binding EF-hand superfamily protein
MLTDLNKRKLSHLFKILDFDHNGYIQESDLVGVAENISIIRGIIEGTERNDVLLSSTTSIWEAIERFHKNKEMQSCSLEQWLEFIDSYLVSRDIRVVNYFARQLTKDLFTVFDHDVDGQISKLEYMCIFMSFRVDIKEVNMCFAHLDLNKDGYINADELATAIVQFVQSNESSDRGNLLFGNFDNYYFKTREGVIL